MNFRVAATFRSPRFQHSEPNLDNQLRAMKVLEVEGISSVLKLSQNGRQYEATLSTASEHIDEPAGNLIIYVPRDRRAQELCFGSVLPRRFATWLMCNPHTNIDGNVEVDIINALTSIFASDRAVLGEILDDQGMIELQFSLRDALPDSGGPSLYLSYDGLDVLSRFRSANQLERDKKIGAAGELYVSTYMIRVTPILMLNFYLQVFELLSKLELPGWGLGNWQSTIRTYANIHPEYADLTRWPNRETADLVYPDTQGDLTRILVHAEILNGDWSTRRPTYFIEVKTTTGPCGTPFYMSGNQYRLVRLLAMHFANMN